MRRDLTEFSGWLKARRPEIEGMALARVHGVADPSSMGDPEYVAGLRVAVSAALDYGLTAIERGEEDTGPAPTALLAQARHAARSGVSLGTVVRRYVGGHALLGDFIIQAIEDDGFALQVADLRRIWRIQTTLLDRLVDAVAAEYAQEVDGRRHNAEGRRAERVKMLLAGRLLESDDLQYELDAWHIGVVAHGPRAQVIIQDLAAKLDRRLLLVRPGGGAIWAWFGGQRKVLTEDAIRFAPMPWPAEVSLAIGEPERGLAGWRLTHRQARASVPIASRPFPRMIRYADVALLASALHDEVLATSLQRLYLDPLACEQDGGATLRQTLRAYLAAGRNISSAAAALGVSRQTVSNRLRTVEDRIGCSFDDCSAEMDTALRMQDLGHLALAVTSSTFT